MTRPVRLLHVVLNLNDGGMERAVADLARTTDPAAFDVHVLTLRGFGRFAPQVGPGTDLHAAPPMSKLSLARPAALARTFRRIEPDIIHVHSGAWFKTARAARMAGVPLVYTDHGRPHPDPLAARLLDGAAARWTERVVAVSAPLGAYIQHALHVPADRVEVITNGVDLERLDRLSRNPLERELPPGRVIFGTVGRVEPVKGYDVLLRALARWPEGAPPVTVFIAGDGSERPRLEALARELDLGERVRFLGWVEEPERLYPLLDAFVLSSHSEGTSLSLLEAMALGRPAVVTDVGGNADVLGPELAHWVVPPADPAALAACMAELAADATRRNHAGLLARRRVETGFSLQATAGRYMDLYRRVLDAVRTRGQERE